jgi:ATP synthase protein I
MSKGNNSFRQGMGIAFRLGTELVVATMIGALMGYAVDYYFETKPWGILVGLIFGAAAGCLTVYRTAMTLQFDEEEDNGDQPPKKEEDL